MANLTRTPYVRHFGATGDYLNPCVVDHQVLAAEAEKWRGPDLPRVEEEGQPKRRGPLRQGVEEKEQGADKPEESEQPAGAAELSGEDDKGGGDTQEQGEPDPEKPRGPKWRGPSREEESAPKRRGPSREEESGPKRRGPTGEEQGAQKQRGPNRYGPKARTQTAKVLLINNKNAKSNIHVHQQSPRYRRENPGDYIFDPNLMPGDDADGDYVALEDLNADDYEVLKEYDYSHYERYNVEPPASDRVVAERRRQSGPGQVRISCRLNLAGGESAEVTAEAALRPLALSAAHPTVARFEVPSEATAEEAEGHEGMARFVAGDAPTRLATVVVATSPIVGESEEEA